MSEIPEVIALKAQVELLKEQLVDKDKNLSQKTADNGRLEEQLVSDSTLFTFSLCFCNACFSG